MADCLMILKEKYAYNHRAYCPRNGVFDVSTHFPELVANLSAQFPAADACKTNRLATGLGTLFSMLSGEGSKEKEACSEDEWVEVNCRSLFKSPLIFARKWEAWFESVSYVLDRDEGGYITEDDLRLFYQNMNRKDDTAFVARAFKAIDVDRTGKVSRKEFVKAYVKYFTDPDCVYDDLPLF